MQRYEATGLFLMDDDGYVGEETLIMVLCMSFLYNWNNLINTTYEDDDYILVIGWISEYS